MKNIIAVLCLILSTSVFAKRVAKYKCINVRSERSILLKVVRDHKWSRSYKDYYKWGFTKKSLKRSGRVDLSGEKTRYFDGEHYRCVDNYTIFSGASLECFQPGVINARTGGKFKSVSNFGPSHRRRKRTMTYQCRKVDRF